MNIIYIAYSCLPNKGSEEKIGWSIPLLAAKEHNVIVITKEEHREKIESYLKENDIKNIRFYYVDINGVYKKIFKGIMYSVRLNLWHKKAYPVVKEICGKEHIDIIHQITPVEFRSVGRYSDIKNVRFVCGPLGGGEFLPDGLKVYAKGNMPVEYVRKMLNGLSRLKYKLNGRLNKCDYVMFANKETQEYLSGAIKSTPYSICSEIGVSNSDICDLKTVKPKSDKFIILVAGRLTYRKGHSLLLDVLKELSDDIQYECRIVGEGPAKKALLKKCDEYKLNKKVVFTGRIDFEKMSAEYENADVFVMPSLRETTGSVLLEAASKGLSIITINRYGGAVLLNETPYLYDGNTTQEIKENFKKALMRCVCNRDNQAESREKSLCIAQRNTWERKIKYYNSIYKKIV